MPDQHNSRVSKGGNSRGGGRKRNSSGADSQQPSKDKETDRKSKQHSPDKSGKQGGQKQQNKQKNEQKQGNRNNNGNKNRNNGQQRGNSPQKTPQQQRKQNVPTSPDPYAQYQANYQPQPVQHVQQPQFQQYAHQQQPQVRRQPHPQPQQQNWGGNNSPMRSHPNNPPMDGPTLHLNGDEKHKSDPQSVYAMFLRVQDVAVAAARAAGSLLKARRGAKVHKTKAHQADLLTQVDLQCEKIILNTISRHFPTHYFLGEEGEGDYDDRLKRAMTEEWSWIVDPIDGTTNFVHSIPCSVVSIGVAYKREVVVGVIYDPYRDELFTACKGKGATLNGARIRVSDHQTLSQALIASDTPRDYEQRRAINEALDHLAPTCRGVRNFGAAALHLAWVACGRVDGFMQFGLSTWDLAAGSIIIREAGGKVLYINGQRDLTIFDRDILCANPHIIEQLSTTVKLSQHKFFDHGIVRPMLMK